jgi:hypothetical protein
MTVTLRRRTLRPDVLKQAKGLVPISIVTEWVYTLLGEKMEVGNLTHEYTAVQIALKKTRGKKGIRRGQKEGVRLAAKGSKDTVLTIRPGDLIGMGKPA